MMDDRGKSQGIAKEIKIILLYNYYIIFHYTLLNNSRAVSLKRIGITKVSRLHRLQNMNLQDFIAVYPVAVQIF